MGFTRGPRIVTDGLVLALDAASPRSYPGSGTTLFDLSGNGNEGTLTSGPTFSTQNKGAIQVDGSENIAITGMPTTNNYTLCIWSLNLGPTAFASVGHRTYACTDNFRLQWDDTSSTTIARGPFVDFVSSAGNLVPSNFTSQSPSDIFNKWNLASMTSDGSTTTIYFNNIQGATTTSARVFSTDGAMTIGTDNLSGIGGSDNFNRDGGNCFFGPVYVYNRALTANEITQNYNTLKPRFEL